MTLRFALPSVVDLVSPPPPAPPLALGFLCPHNPFDRRAFSGTAFFAARALAARGDVRLKVLGPHRPPRAGDRLRERLLGGRPAQIDPGALDLDGLDAVVGLVASQELDRLRARLRVPYLHVTDATPAFLREAYGWDVPQEADAVERRVARGAAAVLYSSAFMARRATADLEPGIDPWVAPFGVNFENLPGGCPAKPPLSPLNLLFVGMDWQRKGGDIALATLDLLRGAGRNVRLTVVGRLPRDLRGHPGLTHAGYLDKNRPAEAARLANLYAGAHLLLVPSRGDCTPMVAAEAMAHGTPVLATDTGGMATLVRPGMGALLPAGAGPADWAAAVGDLTGSANSFGAASARAFTHARSHLNWKSWADRVVALLEEIRARPPLLPAA